MIFVGIDPGATTGIAALSDKGKLLHLSSIRWDIVKVYGELLRVEQDLTFESGELKCVGVEVPANILYARNSGKGAINMAICAGKNIERAKSLVSMIKSDGFFDEVYEITPRREKKWTPEYFKLAYKWDKKTNEHQRDAVRIAERTWAQWKMDHAANP